MDGALGTTHIKYKSTSLTIIEHRKSIFYFTMNGLVGILEYVKIKYVSQGLSQTVCKKCLITFDDEGMLL